VYKNEQGRAKQQADLSQAKRMHVPLKLKDVEYNACQAKHGKSTPSMLVGEGLPLGKAQGKLDANRQNDQGLLHPSPGLADHAGQNQTRLTRRRHMSQRPQAFPTLFHGPGSRQHNKPPDHLTDRRQVNQPQAPLLMQSSIRPALHLSADSLSNRTLPESMLTQPFAISMGT
jgi:hypothetical protein